MIEKWPIYGNVLCIKGGTVTFFIQTFFIRDKVYTQQNLYKHYLYVTKFIRDKVYTVTKFIHNRIYTVTKFIQTLFIR